MRRTVKILLIIICILLFNIKISFASEPNAIIKVDNETVKVGDSIQVTINASCEEYLSAVEAELEYDKEVLTLEEVIVEDSWRNYGDETKLELLINSATKVTDVDVCKIIFKVNDNASEGTTNIKANKVKITDISNNATTIESIQKTINITKEGAESDKNPSGGTEKTLSNIEIATAPNKTTYTEGEKFDKTGMKIIAKYSDGTSKEITDYKCSPEGELKTTDTKITISYTENETTKTVEQEIKVTKKAEETNKENNKDNSTAEKEYPKTGAETIIIPICIVIIITAVSYKKYKRYKKI